MLAEPGCDLGHPVHCILGHAGAQEKVGGTFGQDPGAAFNCLKTAPPVTVWPVPILDIRRPVQRQHDGIQVIRRPAATILAKDSVGRYLKTDSAPNLFGPEPSQVDREIQYFFCTEGLPAKVMDLGVPRTSPIQHVHIPIHGVAGQIQVHHL